LGSALKTLDDNPTDQGVAEVQKLARELGISSIAAENRATPSRKQKETRIPGRRFRSSDGYEIVVGRNDRENDALTFRIGRSSDVWLHAADYPGSHVLIRNPSRAEVPHRTIKEAAELAALNSQAKSSQKAAVHYTLKKFVSKAPRAKPGLVRLSSF